MDKKLAVLKFYYENLQPLIRILVKASSILPPQGEEAIGYFLTKQLGFCSNSRARDQWRPPNVTQSNMAEMEEKILS